MAWVGGGLLTKQQRPALRGHAQPRRKRSADSQAGGSCKTEGLILGRALEYVAAHAPWGLFPHLTVSYGLPGGDGGGGDPRCPLLPPLLRREKPSAPATYRRPRVAAFSSEKPVSVNMEHSVPTGHGPHAGIQQPPRQSGRRARRRGSGRGHRCGLYSGFHGTLRLSPTCPSPLLSPGESKTSWLLWLRILVPKKVRA